MTGHEKITICVKNVSKEYKIYSNRKDRAKQFIKEFIFPKIGVNNIPIYYTKRLVLDDISFNIFEGEVIGILGRNGAGKSTLLQLIAGTLNPNAGSVHCSGRVTALLELGSGFNPEFTGRENVFHNAQILGLNRREIQEKFHQIEAFADIGEYIDQPVKNYSSGMMMRLAFSVQTALDPKILIIDEALSVGDARFQEKCFRKLKQLRDAGVTILFVTHDVNTVASFCDRAILLEAGKLLMEGPPKAIVEAYVKILYGESIDCIIKQEKEDLHAEIENRIEVKRNNNLYFDEEKAIQNIHRAKGRFGNGAVTILSIVITDHSGVIREILLPGENYTICQKIKVNKSIDFLSTGFIIKTKKSEDIFGVTNKSLGQNTEIHAVSGNIISVCYSFTNNLAPGEYILHIANAGKEDEIYDCYQSAMVLTVGGKLGLFTTSIVNLYPKISVEVSNDH